jgi:signal transduction histidine kinase
MRILGRLGIRGKLNLLLMLPLTAVILVSVPSVVGQIGTARSAGQTADVTGQARELSAVVWELQRELLLTVDYVASPAAGSGSLIQQQHTVDGTAEHARAALGPGAPDEVAAALVRIGSLQELRQNALRRGVSLDSVARTYRAVIEAVIDAPRLLAQKNSDAEGTRQLTALDALLRANEQTSLRGMAVIIVAANPTAGQVVLDSASAEASIQLERFVQQANVEHAKIVVDVDQGEAARRVDALVGKLPETRNANATQTFISDVLGAVDAQSGQRRRAQDQVTRQITDAATGRANSARQLAWTIGVGAAVLFALVAILVIAVSRSIADPLRRLTSAATTVADLAGTELVRVSDTEDADEQAPRLATIDVSSSDELGELAAAFNRVQTTAAELVERQAVTRRNVSLMFANVAKRTQNLVGRQLALVDELERNEQDTRLLASLYRLDHLSTRLRRNADNLLVVSGTRDESRIAGPIELPTALRSALAEIEDYQRVRLGAVGDVVLSSSFASDAVLVFAELLDNATSFSPPGSSVDVDTTFLADGSCMVAIVDHGIGMTQERLAEENRRLVERERLELAPTGMLGLFVVGRLARRHALTVELLATPGGGVTARLTIRPRLLTHRVVGTEAVERPAWPDSAPEEEPDQQARHLPSPAIAGMRSQSSGGAQGFRWFQSADPAVVESVSATFATAAEPVDTTTAPSESRGGLRRRVAGAQLPGTVEPPKPELHAARPEHDPVAAKAAFDGYQSGVANAAASAIPPAPAVAARAGLTRRIPGAQLAPGLLQQRAGRQSARVAADRPRRDPNAERAAFDGFTTGLAKAASRDVDQREESME